MGAVALASFAGCFGGDEEDGDGAGGDGGDGDGQDGDTVNMDGFSVPSDNVVPNSEIREEQEIGEYTMIVLPPKAAPNDFESYSVWAKEVAKLGIDVKLEARPRSIQVSVVWDINNPGAEGREGKNPLDDWWDGTSWQMSSRPSRMDPDEFLFTMGHPVKQTDYNYYFWENRDFLEAVEAQRREMDKEKRRELVHECQQLWHEDAVSTFYMYPQNLVAYNSDKWEGTVNIPGLGIRQMVTWNNLKPKTNDRQLNIVYPVGDQIQPIVPFTIKGIFENVVTRCLYDRLAWPDENGKPVPRFAKEFNLIDDTTLEVPLREDGRFHNGDKVLAEDVKFSQMIHHPDGYGFNTYFTASVLPLEDVEIADDYRVIFHMKEPYAPIEVANFLRLMIGSKKYWEETVMQTDEWKERQHPELVMADPPIGSGFLKWEEGQGRNLGGQEINLVAFEDHYDPVEYDRMNLRMFGSVQTAITQLQAGGTDFLIGYRGDPNVLQQVVDQENHLSSAWFTEIGFKQLSYNHDHPPGHLKGWRRALSHRFPKQKLIDEIYNGRGVRAFNQPTSKALGEWHNDDLEPYEFSLQAAADELVKEGFVWGEDDGKVYMPPDKWYLTEEDIWPITEFDLGYDRSMFMQDG